MEPKQSIFLIGVGYIGLNVLDQLLGANYSVTVLTRRPEQASELEKRGVNTIIGSLDDLKLLTTQAVKHPIIINTASCDDLPSVNAILAGVRQRVSANLLATYIHTSGTGALEDGALGNYKSHKIYRDSVRADIDSIPATSMHRHVDIPIIKAAQEFGERAKIAVILPPWVYGYDRVHKRHSLGLPGLTRFALKRGFSGYVGEGKNVWNTIHVKDLARAYLTLLTYIESSQPSVLLENPWFFAENGYDMSIGECARQIGHVLHEVGKLESPEARPFTESDYDEIWGPFTPRGLGCNARSRADRLRALGWKPVEKDIWTSLREEDGPALLEEYESVSHNV